MRPQRLPWSFQFVRRPRASSSSLQNRGLRQTYLFRAAVKLSSTMCRWVNQKSSPSLPLSLPCRYFSFGYVGPQTEHDERIHRNQSQQNDRKKLGRRDPKMSKPVDEGRHEVRGRSQSVIRKPEALFDVVSDNVRIKLIRHLLQEVAQEKSDAELVKEIDLKQRLKWYDDAGIVERRLLTETDIAALRTVVRRYWARLKGGKNTDDNDLCEEDSQIKEPLTKDKQDELLTSESYLSTTTASEKDKMTVLKGKEEGGFKQKETSPVDFVRQLPTQLSDQESLIYVRETWRQELDRQGFGLLDLQMCSTTQQQREMWLDCVAKFTRQLMQYNEQMAANKINEQKLSSSADGRRKRLPAKNQGQQLAEIREKDALAFSHYARGNVQVQAHPEWPSTLLQLVTQEIERRSERLQVLCEKELLLLLLSREIGRSSKGANVDSSQVVREQLQEQGRLETCALEARLDPCFRAEYSEVLKLAVSIENARGGGECSRRPGLRSARIGKLASRQSHNLEDEWHQWLIERVEAAAGVERLAACQAHLYSMFDQTEEIEAQRQAVRDVCEAAQRFFLDRFEFAVAPHQLVALYNTDDALKIHTRAADRARKIGEVQKEMASPLRDNASSQPKILAVVLRKIVTEELENSPRADSLVQWWLSEASAEDKHKHKGRFDRGKTTHSYSTHQKGSSLPRTVTAASNKRSLKA
ncbi:unnamed protein product [Amoebophrya sp. A25]|nr:unnamed protein product [Amoebophrya sp. A25]|eukprot:GSA25T00002138001.1